MSIIPLLVFASLCLAAISVVLFLWSARLRDSEHSDRLTLMPLEEDAAPRSFEEVPHSETERS
ncbi:MAG: cbb3-type cytochrome oxidase assembly protein [Planctomycetota bacterium]